MRYLKKQTANNMAKELGVIARKMDIELNTKFMSVVGSGISQAEVLRSIEIWKQASLKIPVLHKQYDVLLTPTVATQPYR